MENEELVKYCPLHKQACWKWKCGWWKVDGCAIKHLGDMARYDRW